jgi:hypothetical protein
MFDRVYGLKQIELAKAIQAYAKEPTLINAKTMGCIRQTMLVNAWHARLVRIPNTFNFKPSAYSELWATAVLAGKPAPAVSDVTPTTGHPVI